MENGLTYGGHIGYVLFSKRGLPLTLVTMGGVHLTSQIAKVVERIVGCTVLPFLERAGAFGDFQFAYKKGHISRDVLCFLTNSCLLSLAEGEKVGV